MDNNDNFFNGFERFRNVSKLTPEGRKVLDAICPTLDEIIEEQANSPLNRADRDSSNPLDEEKLTASVESEVESIKRLYGLAPKL